MQSVLAACCLAALTIGAATPTPTPQPVRSATPPPKATPVPARPTPSLTPTPVPTSTPPPPATATPVPVPTATPPRTPVQQLHVGLSAEGRPIDAYTVGSGSRDMLVIGGIHGAPEANSSQLVWQLLSTFIAYPRLIPPNVGLIFIPEANPDGLADGTRELADGVDPNRNWPTADWSPDSFGPDGYLSSGGGPAPLSEPETQALAAFVVQSRPAAIVSYHSAAGLVMGGPTARSLGLFDAYVEASRYTGGYFSAYPVTGDFAQWCDEDLQIPTVEIELADHFDSQLDRNLAGVLAVLQRVAAEQVGF